jgi:hypothetical protein
LYHSRERFELRRVTKKTAAKQAYSA